MSEGSSPIIERSRNERAAEQSAGVSTPLDERAVLTVSRNVTPVRAEPTPDSEQLTQAVIGEPLTLFGSDKGWLEIETWDCARGWVRESAAVEPRYGRSCAQVTALIADAREQPFDDADLVTRLPIGATVGLLEDVDDNRHVVTSPPPPSKGELATAAADWLQLLLPDGATCWVRASSVAAGVDCGRFQPASVVEIAKLFIGTPYLWGGTTPFGIDCSGLSQLVYRLHGVNLPRNSRQQAVCEELADVGPGEIQAGDLLFFGPAGKTGVETVSHVGIAMGHSEFIHSYGPTGVIISRLDAEPFSAMLRVARRPRSL